MISLPPAWKIKREIDRINRQISSVWIAYYSYFFGSYSYDLKFGKHVKTYPGAIAFSPKVAIYVVYPKHGFLDSHEKSLDYIIDQGYAPIIVSNLPFENEDRKKLLSKCWLCVERPNIGYDFGAYREGILQLHDRFSDLERVALLNDSSWFPIGTGPNWIREAEALGVDYAAASSSQGTTREETDEVFSGEWKFNQKHKNFHYGSFAVLFGQRILQNPKFYRFWKRFPLTDEKDRTVRRGEMGLTKWVLRNGFTHASTFRMGELKADLSKLSDEQLYEIADGIIIFADPKLAMLKKSVLEQPDFDRDKALRLILTCVSRIGASYCFPDYAINTRGLMFLKKSPLHIDTESSSTLLRFIETLPDNQFEYVHLEALEIAKNVKTINPETKPLQGK
ncbi:MAG: rhamnan synthesis F family protein [Dinoroseobacter sp.]|nr:rhamnan synthesis F family protein [Dinoroseobacter sp.]